MSGVGAYVAGFWPGASVQRRAVGGVVAVDASESQVTDGKESALDTVRWLPLLDVDSEVELEPSGAPGTMVLPLFSFGSTPCMPHSLQELSIFEPRYRRMYNDILVSGSRRFVTTAIHPEDGRLAEVGSVLYLEELRDVSEMSSDQVKYVCNHRVIGRVRIVRVLNPKSLEDSETYVRVETMPVEDEDPDADLHVEEAEVMAQLARVTELQKELEVVQIEPEVANTVNASKAEKGGLWELVGLWSDYFEYLIREREMILDQEMQQMYDDFYEANPDEKPKDGFMSMRRQGFGVDPEDYDDEDDEDIDEMYSLDEVDDDPEDMDDMDIDMDDMDEDDMDLTDEEEDEFDALEEVYLDELPPKLRNDIRKLKDDYEDDVESLVLQQAEAAQLPLQTTSHRERLRVMKTAFIREERRLAARKTLLDAVG